MILFTMGVCAGIVVTLSIELILLAVWSRSDRR